MAAAAKAALILGGAGFIGTHLATQLVESGQYRRIVSLDIAAPERPAPRVMYHRHDVREPLHKTIDGHFDVVFNFAAVHRTPGHPDTEYYDTNVAGAVNAVAFCERNDINSLFFTSSISVYGPSEQSLDEASPLLPNSAYGRSKRLAEDIHRAWLERAADRRLRIVRPAVVFGEGENGNYTLLAGLLRKGLFIYPGRKDTLKASGYVKELVRTMMFALDRPEPFYLYNFADRRIPTAEEICEAFCAQGGMHAPIGVLPLALMDFAALFFEGLNLVGIKNVISRQRVHKLVYSTNVVPRRLIEDRYSFAYTLESAIGDWLATDPTILPLESRPQVAARIEAPAMSIQTVPEHARPRRAGTG